MSVSWFMFSSGKWIMCSKRNGFAGYPTWLSLGWAPSLEPRFLYQTNAGYQMLDAEPYLFRGHQLPNPLWALPNEPDNTEISKEIYCSCSKSLIIKNFPKWVRHTGRKWDVLCEVNMSSGVCPLCRKLSHKAWWLTGACPRGRSRALEVGAGRREGAAISHPTVTLSPFPLKQT